MGILSALFGIQTPDQKYRAEHTARRVAAIRANATGFDSFLDVRRKEDDALRAKVEGFLGDIDAHFTRAGLGAYLTKEYNPKTKFEDLTRGVRRMGIKWRGKADDLDVAIGFMFIEQQGDVRLDYLFQMGVLLRVGMVAQAPNSKNTRIVVNDTFYGPDDDAFKKEGMFKDEFRSMRRFETYEDFQDAKAGPPKWFGDMLKAHIKAIP